MIQNLCHNQSRSFRNWRKIDVTFDVTKGYWQIPMNANDKAYTAFVTHRGLHQFRVMPFGLVKAPATFNRLMRKLLHGSEFLDNYVDDVLTHTPEYSKPSFGRGYNLQASHPMPGSSSHETETTSQTSQNQKTRFKRHQREICVECLDIP